jgi:two-component system response regulator FixJ
MMLILEAVRAALAQSRQSDMRRQAAVASRRISTLTNRERQVLIAITSGRTTKEIALDLGLSVRTVEVHRARMMRRLGVKHLSEAIRLFFLADRVAVNN